MATGSQRTSGLRPERRSPNWASAIPPSVSRNETPILGPTFISYVGSLMTSGALRLQQQYPDRESVLQMMEKSTPGQADANDIIYEMEASLFYDPAPPN